MDMRVVLALFLVGLVNQAFASQPPHKQCKAQLTELTNGFIDAEIKEYYDPDDRIWYFCEDPYFLVGPPDVLCLPNGEWDYPPPICDQKFCRRRDAPENGSQDPDQEKYLPEDTVKYSCDRFFTLVGSPFAVCIPNGEWSHEVPTCKAITCRELEAPQNGELDPDQDEYTVGDKVFFSCSVHYQLVGSRKLTCLPTGEWDDVEPTCEAITCDPLDPPKYGSLDPVEDVYFFKDTISFDCNDGFTLVGSDEVTCGRDGQWSDDVPECQPRECERPDDPANGDVVSRGGNQQFFNPGEKVWFRCDDGFTLDGAKDFVCQDDGSWRPQPFPKCVARQCKRPDDPANGDVVSRGGNQQFFNPGEKVWFRCDDGFTLDGAKDFVCQDDGSWRPQPFPKCVGHQQSTCPGNGWTTWYDHDNQYGRCDCEFLKDLRSRNPGRICERPTGIEAREVSTKHLYKSNLPNVRISPTYGFVCWNTKHQSCKDYEVRFCCPSTARQCKRPDDPSDGDVTSKNGHQEHFNPGEKVWFKCDEGFTLVGAKDFTCQKDGSWRPQPFPKCVRHPQSSCPDNSWTTWYDRDNQYGNCDCEFLKDLRSENRGRICERPTGIEAREVRTKHLYKSNLPNIKISPTSGFVCWNTKHHSCKDYEVRFCCPSTAKRCKRPDDPSNGDVTSKNGHQEHFNPGEKVWFKCDDGFTLVGAKDFTCQKDGSWRPQPFPKCVRHQQSTCPGNGWTTWYDHDNQYGRCDCEFLKDLRSRNPGRICERPTGIEAREVSTKHLYKSNLPNVRISPTYGFVCWNTKHQSCKDYEVRFCCPSKATPNHQTAVACEGDYSKYLRCPRGHKIQIVSGFYGRDDRTTCPGDIYSTKCFAKNSLAKLKEQCHNRYSCRLQPRNHVFGDPCEGTQKYIKLTYYCQEH